MGREARQNKKAVREDSDVELDASSNDEDNQSGSDDKESLMQVLGLLTEVKKNKASKLSSSYVQQKRTIFKDARATHAELTAAGTPYIAGMLAAAARIRGVPSSPDDSFDEIAKLCRSRTVTEQDILAESDAFMQDLSSNRVSAVRQATELVNRHDSKRAQSRKLAKRKAKQDFDQHLEEAEIATDARELLRGYRKLLIV